ncbi:hypothetical protein A5672_13330 [Mycobacterium alsense]|uniref:Uncharacterized protein n=1 Tax=Mycobacterium alsense TaxID=324058 RepID=A0ABD6P5Z9_9MYCO|nr:hypothetical protein A5672_13330 [Mycobacterium alsense]
MVSTVPTSVSASHDQFWFTGRSLLLTAQSAGSGAYEDLFQWATYTAIVQRPTPGLAYPVHPSELWTLATHEGLHDDAIVHVVGAPFVTTV